MKLREIESHYEEFQLTIDLVNSFQNLDSLHQAFTNKVLPKEIDNFDLSDSTGRKDKQRSSNGELE